MHDGDFVVVTYVVLGPCRCPNRVAACRDDEDLFGLFDGHGGLAGAEFAGMHISASVQEAMANLDEPPPAADMHSA